MHVLLASALHVYGVSMVSLRKWTAGEVLWLLLDCLTSRLHPPHPPRKDAQTILFPFFIQLYPYPILLTRFAHASGASLSKPHTSHRFFPASSHPHPIQLPRPTAHRRPRENRRTRALRSITPREAYRFCLCIARGRTVSVSWFRRAGVPPCS